MRKVTITALFILIFFQVFSQETGNTISLIPIPVSMQTESGEFTLTKNVAIELATNDTDTKRVAGFLS